MTLGEKLRQARLAKGLSQRQAAGNQITRNMLSQLEHDQASPSLRTLEYLASVLDVPVAWLLDQSHAENVPDTLEHARSLYAAGEWSACLSLLEAAAGPKSEELELLRCRSALKQSEFLLEQGILPEAARLAQTVLQSQGMYLESWETCRASMILVRCALRQGQEAEALMKACTEHYHHAGLSTSMGLLRAEFYLSVEQLEEAEQALWLLEPDIKRQFEYLLLHGKLMLRKNMIDEALANFQQAEALQTGGRLLRLELYRCLEFCWKCREDYKMAYHYAVLRLEEDQ